MPRSRTTPPGASASVLPGGISSLCFGGDLRVEPVGGALGQAAVVGKDQGAAVPRDIAQHVRDHRGPDGVAGQVAEVLHHRHHLQVQRLAGSRCRRWSPAEAPARRRRRPSTPARPGSAPLPSSGLLRGRQADALHGPAGFVLQALQAQRQVHAALVAAQGVDLVHDDGVHRAEHLARARAGQHQVERFGRGDQDVRRLLAASADAGVGRGVAGAHGHAQRRQRLVPVVVRLARMPASGARRLRSMSLFSALSGEM